MSMVRMDVRTDVHKNIFADVLSDVREDLLKDVRVNVCKEGFLFFCRGQTNVAIVQFHCYKDVL